MTHNTKIKQQTMKIKQQTMKIKQQTIKIKQQTMKIKQQTTKLHNRQRVPIRISLLKKHFIKKFVFQYSFFENKEENAFKTSLMPIYYLFLQDQQVALPS